MGAFSVKFGIDTNYLDPDYRALYVKVIGEVSVSCEGREGSDSDQEFIRGLLGFAFNNVMSDLSSKQVSVKQLVIHRDEFKNAVADALKERDVALTSFNLMNVGPDQKSRERMEKIDKLKEMSSKSPEELAKMQQEAARKAQEYWDSLTPEQRKEAEERSRKQAEEAAEKMRKAMESAQKYAAASGASATTANAMATAAGLDAMKAAAMAPAPAAAPVAAPAAKFCTNCGTPSKGGKFCSNCGKPL